MKTAIVTGASKGVGYATVKLLSESGYKVIAVSRDLSKVSELISNNVEVYRLDITNSEEIKRFYDKYKDMALQYDVKILPDYRIYRNKMEIKRKIGYTNKKDLLEWMK